jgi:hypothetical protein
LAPLKVCVSPFCAKRWQKMVLASTVYLKNKTLLGIQHKLRKILVKRD